MKKIFILDTNVLLHDSAALSKFHDNIIVIPMVVVEEMDNFKKGLDEKGRNARQFSRDLDKLRNKKNANFNDGIETETGAVVKIILNKSIKDTGLSDKLMETNDNLIISTAYWLSQENNEEVILVSKDANVRIKANAVGIKAENYENDQVSTEELYSGLEEIKLEEHFYSEIQEKDFIDNDFGDFYANQFVHVSFEGIKDKILLKYDAENEVLKKLEYYHQGMPYYGIHALNLEQQCALELLLDENIKLVSLIGEAGTGKTLLAIAAGLYTTAERNIYKRLLISRPISPLGKELGFLPGTKEEKFTPWMQPIYDNLEIILFNKRKGDATKNENVFKSYDLVDEFMEYNFIELEPLTYIRGRSLPEQFMIIDEAQNLTPHEMKTIITRAGQNTKIVLTGDPYQIDIPYLDSQSNGLSRSVEKMKNENLVGHITLKKGERSALATLAAKYL